MTSPVDTSVKHFFSSMIGAPVLTKSAGTLIALLDAVLVLGFDLKTVTSVTVANGVATVAFPGDHSATPHSVLLIAGATGAYTELNGEQKVVTRGNGTLTFATNAPAGTAAGTITMKMAPAGWSKPFSGTNIAVYKSLDPLSNGMYLRVDDSGSNPGPGMARVRGYTTMSAVSTGTGLFPSNAQVFEDPTRGSYWPKGNNPSAGTTPIGWSIYADSRVFYYGPQFYQAQIDPESTSYPRFFMSYLHGFGDMISYRPAGDAFSTVLSGHDQLSGAQSYPESGNFAHGGSTYGLLVAPRKADGSGTPEKLVSLGYGFIAQGALSGQATGQYGPFPNPVDGSLVYAPRYLRTFQPSVEADFAPRCEVPGLLSIPQSQVHQSLGRDALLDGEGRWAGRKLYGHATGNPSADGVGSPDSVGVTLVDLTGPWR